MGEKVIQQQAEWKFGTPGHLCHRQLRRLCQCVASALERRSAGFRALGHSVAVSACLSVLTIDRTLRWLAPVKRQRSVILGAGSSWAFLFWFGSGLHHLNYACAPSSAWDCQLSACGLNRTGDEEEATLGCLTWVKLSRDLRHDLAVQYEGNDI